MLAGGRIEIPASDLTEGQTVDIVVTPRPQPGEGPSILEFLESLPPGPRGAATWEELDRHIRELRG
jgi:hypothetical protein